MWRNALRDLQWRKRRYAVAILGASFVFAMSLASTGLVASFEVEARDTQSSIGADNWIVPDGSPGPFTGLTLMPGSLPEEVSRIPGVREADGLIIGRQTVMEPDPTDVALIGHVPGGLGTPDLTEGRGARGPGEMVADASLGSDVGDRVMVAGDVFTITGLTRNLTVFAGQPTVFVPLAELQRTLMRGTRMVTAVAVRGTPSSAPEGYRVMSDEAVLEDQMRPLRSAVAGLRFLQLLLWIVAAAIIGSVVYLSALERTRDFAVFKATGESTRSLLIGVAVQATVVAASAAVVACVLSVPVAAGFPLRAEVPLRAYPALMAMALTAGLVASAFGIRRTVNVEPALAFGGS